MKDSLIVTGLSFLREFTFSVTHICPILVFAWLRAISESSSFGESGDPSYIIWALWDCTRVLMDTRRKEGVNSLRCIIWSLELTNVGAVVTGTRFCQPYFPQFRAKLQCLFSKSTASFKDEGIVYIFWSVNIPIISCLRSLCGFGSPAGSALE